MCCSPHAHARIRKIDTRRRSCAGVLLVLTGADVRGRSSRRVYGRMMPEDLGARRAPQSIQKLLQSGQGSAFRRDMKIAIRGRKDARRRTQHPRELVRDLH